jgi:hypothetical protein
MCYQKIGNYCTGYAGVTQYVRRGNHMGDLVTEGYLAPEISDWIEKHHTENEAWFSLVREINRFAQEQMLKMDINNMDYQKLLVAAGFIRALSLFQGVVLMSERGMVFEAGTLLRGQIEAMFVVAAAGKERKFAHRYIVSDGTNKLRLMKNLLRSDGSIKEMVDRSISWGEADVLRDRLRADNINDIQIKDIAVAAGYPEWYTVVYTYLSQMAAHPTPMSLDNYLLIEDGENAQELVWGPDVYGIGCILSSAVESLVVVLSKVSEVFGKEWSAVLDSIHARLVELTGPEAGFRFGYRNAK